MHAPLPQRGASARTEVGHAANPAGGVIIFVVTTRPSRQGRRRLRPLSRGKGRRNSRSRRWWWRVFAAPRCRGHGANISCLDHIMMGARGHRFLIAMGRRLPPSRRLIRSRRRRDFSLDYGRRPRLVMPTRDGREGGHCVGFTIPGRGRVVVIVIIGVHCMYCMEFFGCCNKRGKEGHANATSAFSHPRTSSF